MGTDTVSAWQLWRNPILIRYVRSRLRMKAFLLNGVPTLIIATFVFLVAYLLPLLNEQTDQVFAGRSAFIAIFVVQCLIVMLRGTFSVAVGVTREAIEGILEYQRLTPMSPLAKIIGYVIGLPIRETVLCLLTVPFSLYAIWVGEIPWDLVWKLYLVMVSSSLLYHMTGFVAGIVVKKRFLAGFLSQLLMLGLYVVLPQLSQLGYVLFEYLTVRPLFLESLQKLFDIRADLVSRAEEPFFNGSLSLVSFTLLVQGYLFAVFLLIVYRRVRNEEEHLLGKLSAPVVLAGLVAILLGTALPGIENGSIFPSQASGGSMWTSLFGRYSTPSWAELIAIPGLFGFGILVIVLGVVMTVTPTEDQRLKGLRLARKRKKRRVLWYSDAAGSLPTTLVCGLIGAGAWMTFLSQLLESRWYPDWELGMGGWMVIPLAILVPVLCFQLVLETGGRAVWFFSLLFGWLVPPMGAVVLFLATQELSDAFIYLLSISGLSLPFNAMRVGLEGVRSTQAPEAYGLALFIHLGALVLLRNWAWKKRSQLRKLTMGGGAS